MFIYKTDQPKYRKFLEQMENDLLQHKDPATKTVVDACRVLAGWLNKYGNRESKIINAIQGLAFATSAEESNKKTKKKEITCYKARRQDTIQTNVMKKRPSIDLIKRVKFPCI